MISNIELGSDVRVVTHDGYLKSCDDLIPGDKLLSSNSTTLTVDKVGYRIDNGYKVIPTKGVPFVLGLDSKLRLTCNSNKSAGFFKDQEYALTVPSLVGQTKTAKHTLKCFRTAVEFDEPQTLSIDPYFLGLWLGDGSSANLMITNQDPEIEQYLRQFAQLHNLVVRDARNSHQSCPHWFFSHVDNKEFANIFRSLSLFNNKHIPQSYLTAPRKDRLELLAGLLDTDGYLHHGHMEIAVKNDTLANGIILLARSLGFFVANKIKWVRLNGWEEARPYSRVTISGDLELIPTKLPRRQCATRRQIKNVLRTGFKLEYTIETPLVNLTLRGNGDVLTEDFINIATNKCD